MTEQIDALDRRILSVLQSEGRISMTELGDRVGLSTSPCARRVKRLEDEGYISGYVAILSPARLDALLLVFVSVRLNNQTREAFDRFDAAVQRLPEIVACHLLAGGFDYLVQVRAKDIQEFRNFMRERFSAIEGVAETQSSVVLEELKATTELPMLTP
ncbi:Lrp/AsnC ligand binding domain-containing protein [Sulfitobacter pseudonitzschiae]|uniref:Lrp/AsnC family transcriptional regulator n=1 Tax=Pseudosulfitobacter pseudonitzschiae TaxID=1402135 RepID=UPI001D980CE9|nr:Lrp/AsnC ligand binding domain-containing protein [Pseudosulfitobacter pseudonitzschiae]MBM1835189.1 Lrp/AsnC ligand binding domain-containing protein [Pseudosulfitobacter pseudonitzschiae]MBM1840057.1 Lrp/AsnC ligand binding domain-containing protein [Pseudosulfitobacter pseudonitzschiae]MBM1844921.1 Lrp/AsnC ligand binding domain-containing protein [Pseudosulfitobacter pseudonitzschiae]MBM1849764.1 Lrp/AsnC ligand binding domain-containing protein [Pseudosulfitobacter pseudonitzschiae]